MHASQSVLRTIVERIRTYLDEPDADAKYTDDYIVRHTIYPSMVDVLNRLALTIGSPVILFADLTEAVTPQTRRLLPPCALQILRLVLLDEDDNPALDIQPRDYMHRCGAGWRIEGNPGAQSLVLDEPYASIPEMTVWYTTNGDVQMHVGDGVLADNSGVDRIALDTSPQLGSLDRRPNAYAGQVIRVIPDSDVAAVEERQITRSYLSSGTWYVDLVRPLTETADGAVEYEIAPPGAQSLCEAVAARSAGRLGVGRKITQVHDDRIRREYLMALKTIGDNLTNIQGRVPHHIERNTVDSPSAPYLLPPTTNF